MPFSILDWVPDTSRWTHFNAKLHFFSVWVNVKQQIFTCRKILQISRASRHFPAHRYNLNKESPLFPNSWNFHVTKFSHFTVCSFYWSTDHAWNQLIMALKYVYEIPFWAQIYPLSRKGENCGRNLSSLFHTFIEHAECSLLNYLYSLR